ncbi:MAG: hypothetical protein E7625_07080 [Ruminococcaceae bacterium]|nr:hypothetical protein [Oscillospiraceae bacterium]
MREETETKNLITKETIKADLVRKADRFLLHYGLLFFAFAIVIGGIFGLIYSFGMKPNAPGGFEWAIYLISLLICLSPCFFCLLLVFGAWFDRKKAQSGAFYVVTDKVTGKEEKEKRVKGQVHIEKVIRFAQYGEAKVSADRYLMANEGDEYYMVLYRQNPRVPQAYYPASMYEYRE